MYNPDNDLIRWYETEWTRSASSDTHTFSPDVRMQTLKYKVTFIEHIEVSNKFIASETQIYRDLS